MTLIPGSIDVWQVLSVGVAVFARVCGAMELSSIEKLLGEAVLLSLQNARITVDQAADAMKMHPSQLHKCLRGDASHHFSLNRLLRLPWEFWFFFSSSLVYLVAKKRAAEIADTFGLSRAAD
jgi:hypothetical protein